MKEVWRPVVGHEESYEVSDLGRVRSRDREVVMSASATGRKRRGYTRFVKGRVLRPGRMNVFGHVSVALGKGNSRTVHSLVMEAFVGPRPARHDILHINGDGGDNRRVNLRYGTRSDNNRDITRHGRRQLTYAQAAEIRRRASAGESASALAREFGIKRAHIYNVTRKERRCYACSPD